MASPANTREIFTLASECSALFQRCVRTDQEPLKDPPKAQRDAAALSRDFEAWCFNLGVFAAPTASLDQTLRYSDEIRGFVTQLLSILRRNLEFLKIHAPPEDSPKSTSRPCQKNDDVAEKLQGSTEEALRATSAVLQRLDRLGATIRKYSASSLSSRVKAFAEQDNDEEYRLLAKNIATFKYPTAPSSLHFQLAGSMAYRRQRLRYIRQHQLKTAPKGRQDSKKRDHVEPSLSNPKLTNIGPKRPAPKGKAAALRNQAVYRPKGNTTSKDTETTPSTTAWTVRPTSSAMQRVKHENSKSVISSSKASTTRMVGHLDDYPEPPAHGQWSQDPKCPTCWRQLMESELKGKKWRRHVDTDCEPYVCISEDCMQPPQFFSDLALWENHMRNRHSTKWTQLIHKPTIWICDLDHDHDDDEEFRDHESFQAHLRDAHDSLSEAECKAVATLGETPMARPKHTCPLCGHDFAAQQENHSEPVSSVPQGNDMDQLAKLAKHIAGHLRCLSFHTLDYLDSDHESASEPGTDATSGQVISRSRPPSELKDLDVSSGFSDDDDPRSVSTYDELNSRKEEDLTLDDGKSLQIVSIPPKFEEDWEGIRETRLAEEDPILRSMMTYSLWDRAYDNVKKMEPLLVEKYEIILSKELVNDAQGESKQIVNLFRGVNIYTRQALLDRILGKLLEQIRDQDPDEQTTGQILDCVTKSVREFPAASLPMVGFCLVLTILVDFRVKEESDLTIFVGAASTIHAFLEMELTLSTIWVSPRKALVQIERSLLQLLQDTLEAQFRVAYSCGEFEKPGDWEEPYSDYLDMVRFGIPADPDETADQSNIQCLHRVLGIDPRKVKDRIEGISGGLLRNSHGWLLNHAAFRQFRDDPNTSLLWISGPPGTGKTMLLCSLIDELSAEPAVISYFFCQAHDSQLNNGAAVLRGLLHLLACERPFLISKYRLLEEQQLKNTPDWERLSKLVSTVLGDPLLEGAVLVVDALDECLADQHLLVEFTKKPSPVKWIVSSRDQLGIRDDLYDTTQVTLQLGSHENEMSNVVDTHIQRKVDNLAREKDIDQEISSILRDLLVSKAQGNFLCADLFIEDLVRTQPDHMLAQLRSLPSSLYPLYMERLMSILDSPHSSLCNTILVIAAVVFRPVTLEELRNLDSDIQDLNEDYLIQLISTCGSFLAVRERTIFFVHQSAKDFLLSEASHLIMPMGIAHQHASIFVASIECLASAFQENMYGLRNPGVRIDEIPWLDPDSLLAIKYSCINWVDHLECSGDEPTLHEDLRDSGALDIFLRMHLLHWFEALSLLHGVSEALGALQKLSVFRTNLEAPELSGLLEDAYRFLFYHMETIEGFPLQVYSSALVFSPDQSIVKQLFHDQTSTWIASSPRISGNWDSQAFEVHDSRVLSMAWSWDTQRAVSGSRNGTIMMWDTDANVCIHKISNHGIRVDLVSFSADGSLFASASSDGLIKVWDTNTYECRMGLFGNAGTANQAVFSTHGSLLAVAFSGGLVKIWSIMESRSVQVLDGRCGSMTAVSFSTDGRILASGSIGGHIYLWDVATGQITRELEGHDNSVASIALSADGKQLASSCVDGTLRTWDTLTGSQLQVAQVGRTIRHISFDSAASRYLTDIGLVELSSSGQVSFPGYSLSADELWILKEGKRVLRIPWKYPPGSPGRPVMRGSTVSLGGRSGNALMMTFA